MSPENGGEKNHTSGWGSVSPRDFFQSQIDHEREMREEQWEAHEAKHDKAEKEAEKTAELLNNVSRRFVDKPQYEAEHGALIEKMDVAVVAVNARVDRELKTIAQTHADSLAAINKLLYGMFISIIVLLVGGLVKFVVG